MATQRKEAQTGMVYRGSKSAYAKQISAVVQNLIADRKQFVDMFCGGCSVTCAIPQNIKRIANDMNPYLMALLRWYQSGNKFQVPVTSEAHKKASEIIKSQLRHTGGTPKVDLTHPETLKDMAYLGWCMYVGSIGGEFLGRFCGRTKESARDGSYYNDAQLVKTAEQLKNVTLTCYDYREMKLKLPSVIYCDPPWKGLQGYALSLYNTNQFYEWCGAMKKEGHTILLNEVSAPSEQFKRITSPGSFSSSFGLFLAI